MKFDNEQLRLWMQKIIERAESNGHRFNGRIPFPQMTADGSYLLNDGGHWTDSFWVGIFYLAYAFSKEQHFLQLADGYQPFFKEREQNDPKVCAEKNYIPLDHDIGFLFSLTQVARYKLIQDQEARNLALSAAEKLADRFQPKGQFIRAFNTWSWDTDENFIQEKKGKMIIDTMMNLPLLMWAYQETGMERYREVAVAHALTCAKYIVRKDFSTYHQFNFDPESGMPVRGLTGQGYADESCWSRGQAWAIYGFALMYGYTKVQIFLEIAVGLAEYFIDHLIGCNIPLWDFNTKEIIYRPWDSSAGAIAASGILEISKWIQDTDLKKRLTEKAEAILYDLVKLCSTLEVDSFEPLLLHGCVGPAYHKGHEKQLLGSHNDVPTVYGDYFFVEALMKLYDPDFVLFW